MGYTPLTVEIYESGDTRVPDPNGELKRIENLRFKTAFPAGRSTVASFTVPRNVARSWAVRGGQRLVVRSGLTMVWEGAISAIKLDADEYGEFAAVTAVGYWGWLLSNRRVLKRWIDPRYDVWQYDPASTPNKWAQAQSNNLYLTPGWWGVAFAVNDFIGYRYYAPAGQPVRRVKFDWLTQFDASGGNPTPQLALRLWNHTSGAAVWTQTTTGSGSQDLTLATPAESVSFQLRATSGWANVEGPGALKGVITALSVHSEPGSITLGSIASDVVTLLSGLMSSSTAYIGNPALALDSAFTNQDRYEPFTGLLTRMAQAGDASNNSWAVYVLPSEAAGGSLPVLAVSQYPNMSGFDIAIRLDEPNVAGSISFEIDYASIANWIIVRYIDTNNIAREVTPNDDAALSDAASVATWGRRDQVVNVGVATEALAKSYGKRYLAQFANPVYRPSGPLRLVGRVRNANGQRISVANVYAGQRLRIENFIDELSGGGPLTLLIAETDYEDASETVTLRVGRPDDLVTLLAQQRLEVSNV